MTSPPSSARLLAWGASAAVIVAGGLALYLASGALEPWLAALPDPGAPPPEPVIEATPPPEPEPEPEEPPGPKLTYEEIEAMLETLPARVLELVAAGRRELPEYREMESSDEAQASRGQRFFRNWGTTWSNRVGALEKETPPREECAVHAALEPACALLAEVYELLRTIPAVSRIEEGQQVLDEAQKRVEDFLNPPPEEEEGETGEGEDAAEPATAEG